MPRLGRSTPSRSATLLDTRPTDYDQRFLLHIQHSCAQPFLRLLSCAIQVAVTVRQQQWAA